MISIEHEIEVREQKLLRREEINAERATLDKDIKELESKGMNLLAELDATDWTKLEQEIEFLKSILAKSTPVVEETAKVEAAEKDSVVEEIVLEETPAEEAIIESEVVVEPEVEEVLVEKTVEPIEIIEETPSVFEDIKTGLEQAIEVVKEESAPVEEVVEVKEEPKVITTPTNVNKSSDPFGTVINRVNF